LVAHFEDDDGTVAWRGFLLNLAMPSLLSTPSKAQLLRMLNAYVALDMRRIGQVTRSNFAQVPLWFELDTEDQSVAASGKAAALKDCLYNLFAYSKARSPKAAYSMSLSPPKRAQRGSVTMPLDLGARAEYALFAPPEPDFPDSVIEADQPTAGGDAWYTSLLLNLCFDDKLETRGAKADALAAATAFLKDGGGQWGLGGFGRNNRASRAKLITINSPTSRKNYSPTYS
jgi:hypothetical protein